jgi:hypothetical protein
VTTLKARQVERALVAKLGFEVHDARHRIFRLCVDGRLVARTFFCPVNSAAYTRRVRTRSANAARA